MKIAFFVTALILGTLSLASSYIYFSRGVRLRKQGLGGRFSLFSFMFTSKSFVRASGNQLIGEGSILVFLAAFILYIAFITYRSF